MPGVYKHNTARATTEEVIKHPGNGLGGSTDVRSAFVTFDGWEVRRTKVGSGAPFWDARPGDLFTVLYDPHWPERHRPYCVTLFEAVPREDGAPVRWGL